MDHATGEVMYTHSDQVGSLRAVTTCAVGAGECIPGETATVLQRPVYTAFGELVYDLAPQDTFIRYRYAGDWGYEGRLGSETNGGSDSASGLPYTHVGHRWYDPSTGRFLQRDPIGIDGGLNTYVYVDNNPTMTVDPYGFQGPPHLFGPPKATGPADTGMFDSFWSKVHYTCGVGAGLMNLSFAHTTCLAIQWELVEPNVWPPQISGAWDESLRNRIGDVICAQRGWFDGQKIRAAVKEIYRVLSEAGVTVWPLL